MIVFEILFISILLTIPGSIATDRKHIIFIVADDYGFNDASFRGSDVIPTPNLDALAYSGRILDRHYVLPICTPSRSALLSGTHPIFLGTQGYPMKAGQKGGIPLSFSLVPEHLKELGYKTHLVGKWHVGFEFSKNLPTERGFDTFLGYYSGYIDYFRHTINQTLPDSHTIYSGFDMHDGTKPRWDLQGRYATDVFTERAEEIIQNHDPKDPLFLMITHLSAHTGAEEGDGLQTPPGMNVEQEFGYIESPERRNYAGIVKSMDDSVGRVVEALSESGLLQNSIIVFIADNGAASVSTDSQPNYGSNWPLRGVKFTLFEGGVRGLALIWGKDIQGSLLDTNFYHVTDWRDLIIQMAGGTVDDEYSKLLWNSLKTRNVTKDARDFLLNIDEVENAESVILDSKWKVVKQNYRQYGNYDFHIRTQMNGDEIPEVTPEKVRNSKVGIALQELGDFPCDNTIEHLRKNSAVSCKPPDTLPMGMVQPSTKFFCTDYCVFNIIDDPCELKPLDNTEILEKGKDLLDAYRRRVVPQNTNDVDPASNPEKFGGVWSPWMDVLKADSFIYPSGEGNILCISAALTLLVPILIFKYLNVF